MGRPMAGQSIIWLRLDQPGHDSARLRFLDSFWCLEGAAVFLDGQQPCELNYQVHCDTKWNTVRGRIHGWVGKKTVSLEFVADADRKWRINGKKCTAVAGCIDVDLNFTPATNLLPIRRLQLPVGKESVVQAAW